MIDSVVWIITLGSFIAAFINAAFATGGIYVLLFTTIAVLPISAAIPLQPIFSTASLIGRITFFWKHIEWRIVRMFIPGAFVGVYLGAKTFVALPENILALLLGIILLALIWMPKLKKPPNIKYPFVWVGIVHSYLGSVFGVGGVLQPLVLRMDLVKVQVTGTLAVCMLALDVLKVTGYIAIGFDYLQFIPHIIGATIAGFAGSWVGRRATDYVSETLFRRVFRALVTIVALRLIYRGLM